MEQKHSKKQKELRIHNKTKQKHCKKQKTWIISKTKQKPCKKQKNKKKHDFTNYGVKGANSPV